MPQSKLMLLQQVEVVTEDSKPQINPDDGLSRLIKSNDIKVTAGAYNDIPRFLQTLPGVVFTNDSRNTYLVHGGNDTENLYVIDGVEIPNINNISTAVSSGGFVSIVDTDAVSSIRFHDQLYGSEYSGTLSSVLDINTVAPEDTQRHGEVSMGYAGTGFVLEQPIGSRIETMTQFRHSILNYFTNDIGIDGVPKYENLLSTATVTLTEHDSIKSLFLLSNDSLNIQPNTLDSQDPGLVNTDYRGRRSTGAVTWRHTVPAGGNDLQLNYSSVTTNTLQTDAYHQRGSVYSDRLNEIPVTARYDVYRQYGSYNFQAGATANIHAINYIINQASGYPSPYSLNPAPVDNSNVSVSMLPRNYAAYGEGGANWFNAIQIRGGIRYEHWGINDSSAWMPRADIRLRADEHFSLFGGVASYSQMPSLPTMLGIAQNIALKPVRDVQSEFGMIFSDDFGDQLGFTFYTRKYTKYPVSTQFPSLSLADIVDPFGLPNLYMPMVSLGENKISEGQMSITTNPKRRVSAQANLTEQAALLKALDGIFRLGNYEERTLANVTGTFRISRRQTLTGRYSYHSGTPYTPFLQNESELQQREIYDLANINSLYGSKYERVDVHYEINIPLWENNLKIYGGVDNLLNRKNYYQYVLLPQCYSCGPYELTQMGIYPDGGVVWSF